MIVHDSARLSMAVKQSAPNVIVDGIPHGRRLPQSPEPQIILEKTAGTGTHLALQWPARVRLSAAAPPLPFTVS
jgi:hypothetical protein